MHLHTLWTPLHAEALPAWGARGFRACPTVLVVKPDAVPNDE